jgi:hypothetical protein
VEARSQAVRALASPHPTPASQQDLSRLGARPEGAGPGPRADSSPSPSHPELRSADSFLTLEAQLEGAENRIHVARLGFNDAVRAYNAAIQKLPGAWLAEAGPQSARLRGDEGAERARPLGLD